MPTFDLFSKRKKRAAGDAPDVYIYTVPLNLRVQIIHIWGDAIGNPSRDYDGSDKINSTYQESVEILRREYSVFRLDEGTLDPNNNVYAYNELCKFFMDTKPFRGIDGTDKALDVIEITFRCIDFITRNFDYLYRQNATEIADGAIEELNSRFREHDVGYSYSDGTIIRVDSEFVHAEIIKPALVVLRQKGYSSAQSEFLAAHEHYRQGKNSEALVE